MFSKLEYYITLFRIDTIFAAKNKTTALDILTGQNMTLAPDFFDNLVINLISPCNHDKTSRSNMFMQLVLCN